MARLCSGDLSPNDFMDLIAGHTWPDDALAIAFSPAQPWFGAIVDLNAEFMSQTEQGRIFCPIGELFWRRLNKEFRVVYLGESPPEEGLEDYSSELAGLSPHRRQLLLWGVRTETQNEWMEQQVPHRFEYPVADAKFPRGRVALVVEDWKDTAKLSHFSRYHSIIEVKGEN